VGVSTIPLDTSILRSNSDRYRYDDHDDDEHRTWFFFCFHASTKESKDDEITCLENQIQSLFYSLKIRYKKNKDEYIVRHYHECGSIHRTRLYNFNFFWWFARGQIYIYISCHLIQVITWEKFIDWTNNLCKWFCFSFFLFLTWIFIWPTARVVHLHHSFVSFFL